MLLTGTEYEMSYDASRLRIGRQTPDGPMTLLDVPLTEVLSVEGGLYASDPEADEPEGSVLGVVLADPDLRWEDERLGWAPVYVTCGVDQIDHVRTTVDDLRRHLQRAHRRWLPLPDVTVPPLLDGPYGPRRPDIDNAAQRVQHHHRQLVHLSAVQAQARPDEFVLELTPAADYFHVVTTLRVFTLGYRGEQVTEVPVDAVLTAGMETGRRSNCRVALDLGVTRATLDGIVDPDEAQRLLAGIHFAVTNRLHQGEYVPPRPNACDLARQWETLREQFQLGMITAEEFGRQAAGVLQATW